MNREVCGECWSPKELCRCIDTLWHQAMADAIRDNDPYTRFRFAELIAKREREACANVVCVDCAKAIRGEA